MLAITGLACRYPQAADVEALWQRMGRGPAASPGRLGPSPVDPGGFGIPPIYRNSINAVQLDLMALAGEALAMAGIEADAVAREHTDVIFCNALGMNRQYENYARIAAVEWAEPCWESAGIEPGRARAAWKRTLDETFQATTHDKIGEMASSIPARVAAHFRLRGRAFALEAQERSGLEGLLAAADAIALGQARSVLLLGAQCLASPLVERLLRACLPASLMSAFSEGACALVLQDAATAGARAMALIDDFGVDCGQAPAGEPPAGTGRRLLVLDGIEAPRSGMEAGAVPVDCLLAHDACGYGFSMQVLSALLQAALAQHRGGAGHAQAGDATGLRVAVRGEALDGRRYHIALAPAPAGAPAGLPDAEPPAPVAVLGIGARFGGGQDKEDYWRALQSPTHCFRPLAPERHGSAAYYDEDPRAPLSYYIGAASYCEPLRGDPAAALRDDAFGMALAAGREALDGLPLPLPAGADEVLVVTASNLTPSPLRRLAARDALPRIEAAFVTVARRLGMAEPAVRAAAARLRERGQGGPEAADLGGDACRQLSASGISRELARLAGASARCVAVEAACAGSLAALDLALNSLRSGRCRLAVVAGAETPVNVADLVLCASQRMLSSGLIASFTQAADGFTPGDGAGVLVLATADDAAGWGVPALARIRASASCTQSRSMVAPNPDGQVKAMQRAFGQVDFGPDAIDFVETHGTGTLIGDEVEIASLAAVYGQRARPLHLGALKSRFGHCFAAAGIAGLIKTVLALRAQAIPANYFGAPLKAELRLAASRFDPLERGAPWPAAEARTRRAAVNAFGTGGVNYHVLLEESRG
ncbi:hypothetical protein BKK81_22630 [Cupriavidus sp. USMAHM13]|nr:hypothetical protein BKK81_22630 [Cupriavidus sp. USMAHM13]